MISKLFKTVLYLFMVMVLMSSSCNKNGTIPCHGGSFAFSATSQWSPEHGVYHISDTIFITSTLSKQQTDLINPTIVMDYSNLVGIGGNITIYLLDSIQHEVIPARAKFQVVTPSGVVIEPATAADKLFNFYYEETPQQYTCKIGLICKEAGPYCFFVSDVGSMGLRGKNCTNAKFTMLVTNGDKHLSIFEKAMGRPPVSDYEKQRIYCFEVR